MKIKLILVLILGVLTTSIAQPEEKGWDEGVAAIIELRPYDFKNIPSIYVGNLPRAWTTLGPRRVYSNAKKNVYILSDSNKGKLEIKMRSNIKSVLNQNDKLKAFLSKKKWHIVNEKGEVLKKISK